MLQDTQAQKDSRGIAIQKVGISQLQYPIKIQTATTAEPTTTVAKISACVNLPAHIKGTHMSRFIEIIERTNCFNYNDFSALAEDFFTTYPEADYAFLELNFPYFIRKKAPVTTKSSFVDYQVTLAAHLYRAKQQLLDLTLVVPVTTLCPCSKAISKFGAHNQRGIVTLNIKKAVNIPVIDHLITAVETSASSSLYSTLKRADEKFVTEQAYENPVFVEDLVRNVATKLSQFNLNNYKVTAENWESIHNHNAYAVVEHSN